MTATSALDIVMAMTFGAEGTNGARVHDLEDVRAILNVFKKHGHTEVDTATAYCAGTSESYLGEVGWKEMGLKMDTKLYPWKANDPKADPNDPSVIKHTPESLRKYLMKSLKELKADKLDMWYLHGPDRSTPYEVTLKAVNDLYKEGHFERFGISNYTAWEVAEIVGTCRANGYVQPTAYQGIYNAVHRSVEPELFPCLRKFGLSFYEFNPLGGGFFTGRYKKSDGEVEAGSRFDPQHGQGQNYRARYWNDHYFKALDVIQAASDKAGLTISEVALRWVSHHSLMKREHGDKILIGASSLNHIEQNLVDLEKPALPDDALKALDEAWEIVKPYAAPYFH